MKITEYIKDNTLFLDGGMGTLLSERGLAAGEKTEEWNISHPECIKEIHSEYVLAGSNVICANTFGINGLKYTDDEVEKLTFAAIENARFAIQNEDENHWVAVDIGPTGRLLKPLGDLDFEDAVAAFSKTIRSAARNGADLVFIETMNDIYETKAAVIAAKENCDLPIFVSNAYSSDGNLLTGASPETVITVLEGLGVDAIGMNCSFGPKALLPIVKKYLEYSSLPVIFKPNAGLPKITDKKTVFDVSAKEFGQDVASAVELGVRAVGGCCGTTPEYIKEVVGLSGNIAPKPIKIKDYTAVSSYSKTVFFSKKPVLIGERINPTGKKRLKKALIDKDISYILKEAITEQEKGAEVLDVNVGLPQIDETALLEDTVKELQAVTELPLQIDTSSPEAMEKALRIYNGKPMINSVNGKAEVMENIFPLVKKYGGLTVALTLDEDGIPKTAEERLKIAEKILKTAEKYGIEKKNLIFDPLAMSVSTDKFAAKETLRAVKLIGEKLGCKTVLGVSNVSFGLPQRDIINSAFFNMALTNGLSAAIMNPYSVKMLEVYYAFCTLSGLDDNCLSYIGFAEALIQSEEALATVKTSASDEAEDLSTAIVKGMKAKSYSLAKQMLSDTDGISLINEKIIPALDTVGAEFENKKIYLPQLLMSAEAAASAFEAVKEKTDTKAVPDKLTVVLATVKGDIHDIGKNIVRLLLQNFGFTVIDLGKDVEPQAVVDAVKEYNAKLVGLSALMTTTVPAMEETVALLKSQAKECKIAVGGAVLNKEIAAKIGADYYSETAMDTVRYAETL